MAETPKPTSNHPGRKRFLAKLQRKQALYRKHGGKRGGRNKHNP